MQEVKRHFRPEFLNRLDEIIVFEPLNESVLRQVVEVQLASVMKRLEADRQIKVNASRGALDRVVDLAYGDGAYGARPIRRFVERYIATDLGRKILSGNIPDGSSCIISLKDEGKAGSIPLSQGFSVLITPPEGSKL